MHRTRDNEYQNPTSIGSLVGARACWLALRAAGAHVIPQQFEFTFACPTLPIAHGLAAFLRDSMVWVSPVSLPAAHPAATQHHPFQLDGLTHRNVPSLEHLEHMFTSFRRMGQRHRSTLAGLRLVGASPTPLPISAVDR
jgi:hypothetical protein